MQPNILSIHWLHNIPIVNLMFVGPCTIVITEE